MELLEKLRMSMDNATIEELNITTQSYEIESRNDASYFLKKYKDIMDEQDKIIMCAREERQRYLDQIESWEQAELKKFQEDLNYIIPLLEEFAKKELAGSSKRSLSLPFGSIGFRKQVPKYKYDEEVIIQQLKEIKPGLVKEKIEESIDKVALKKQGTIIDGKFFIGNTAIQGIDIEIPEDKFEIR